MGHVSRGRGDGEARGWGRGGRREGDEARQWGMLVGERG